MENLRIKITPPNSSNKPSKLPFLHLTKCELTKTNLQLHDTLTSSESLAKKTQEEKQNKYSTLCVGTFNKTTNCEEEQSSSLLNSPDDSPLNAPKSNTAHPSPAKLPHSNYYNIELEADSPATEQRICEFLSSKEVYMSHPSMKVYYSPTSTYARKHNIITHHHQHNLSLFSDNLQGRPRIAPTDGNWRESSFWKKRCKFQKCYSLNLQD